MSENINEYKSKLEEFCNTRDKLFTLLQNEENIEKRIHLQELIIKAEENIKNYQLLHINSFSNNKNNNNKINNIEDEQEINSDKELNIETNKNIKEKLNNINNNLKNKYISKKDSSNNKKN